MNETGAEKAKPQIDPLLVPIPTFAAAVGLDERTIRAHINAGVIPSQIVRRICGSVRISVADAKRWEAAGCPREREWAAIIEAEAAQANAGRGRTPR